MTRSVHVVVTAALLLAGSLWAVSGQAPTPQSSDDTSREIMWTKLDLSHNILDALTINDFEALEAYAEDLEMLGSAGVLYILDTDEYRSRAQGFRTAARTLRNAARERNAEASALAYVDLTLRCIRCHRSLDVAPR